VRQSRVHAMSPPSGCYILRTAGPGWARGTRPTRILGYRRADAAVRCFSIQTDLYSNRQLGVTHSIEGVEVYILYRGI
jgi:hypothetical protein